MSVAEDLTKAAGDTGDDSLITAAAVWATLMRQTSSPRTQHLHIAIDALEAIDRGDANEARMLLAKDSGSMWPECLEALGAEFCPLCASVQSAVVIIADLGQADAIEAVRQHLVLLKSRGRRHAEKLMEEVCRVWWREDTPEAGYTVIYEGPGFLAFT